MTQSKAICLRLSLCFGVLVVNRMRSYISAGLLVDREIHLFPSHRASFLDVLPDNQLRFQLVVADVYYF